MRWTPHATVATIVEKDGRFLLVEEIASGERVINQPAGHVEANESLQQAAIRETLEETGWHVTPTALLGMYIYYAPANGVTYHRTCFIAQADREEPNAELDDGIIGPLWLTRDEIAARAELLRSELVLKCIDDYLAGRSFPLDYIHEPSRDR